MAVRSDINTASNVRSCASKLQFMQSNMHGGEYTILDGDAFIMNSIEQIWNIDSDVILTYRGQTQLETLCQ